jgi:hypothetical protein
MDVAAATFYFRKSCKQSSSKKCACPAQYLCMGSANSERGDAQNLCMVQYTTYRFHSKTMTGGSARRLVQGHWIGGH